MNKSMSLFMFVILVTFAVSGCKPEPSPPSSPAAPTSVPSETPSSAPAETVTAVLAEEGGQAMAFELTSSAFAAGEAIPRRYTCDGDDISPPLAWGDPPAGTQGFALISDDPDAPVGIWVHWVLFNLPADARALPEAVPADADLADGSRHGNSSWRRPGYGGPCPPSGTHRYFFKLYALDTVLDLKAGSSKEELLKAMEGHILAETELMGTYSRK
jgi:Raf kinase inhibitor-like YbhB/YbcL family protein